jgi:hypothetical protein
MHSARLPFKISPSIRRQMFQQSIVNQALAIMAIVKQASSIIRQR